MTPRLWPLVDIAQTIKFLGGSLNCGKNGMLINMLISFQSLLKQPMLWRHTDHGQTRKFQVILMIMVKQHFNTVVDADLRKTGAGHSDPEIRRGEGGPPNFFRPFGRQFGLKIRGGGWALRLDLPLLIDHSQLPQASASRRG